MESSRFDARSMPLVVGRTPLFSLDAARALYDAENPYRVLRELLDNDPIVRQVLYVASRSLFEALRDASPPEPGKADKAWLRALCYVVRSAFRTTPFGLCAGFGEVEIGERTRLRIADRWSTITRPDMQVACELAKRVAEEHAGMELRVVANAASIVRGDRLYVTHIALANQRATAGSVVTEQRPVSLRNTEAVRFVREAAAESIAVGELCLRLCDRFEAPRSDAERMVAMMLDAGVLLSELAVTPIDAPLEELRARLRRMVPQNPLEAIMEACAEIDAIPLHERRVERYKSLAAQCASGGGTGTELHVDLLARFDGTLGEDVLREVERLGELLERSAWDRSLKQYRERFMRFYEGVERMVPLLELVNEQLGPGAPDDDDPQEPQDERAARLLRTLAADAQRTLVDEVALSEEQVEVLFPRDRGATHGSRDLAFFVAAESPDELAAGHFTVAPSFLVTNHATQSMGRFARALGDSFVERAGRLARRTCVPGVITAELVYATQPRVYNVIERPQLYDHTLRIGIGDDAHAEELALDDLWVGLDGERFFLWSASRDCEVHLRESHAFVTVTLAPTLCRFLSLLSSQDRPMIPMNPWGRQWHRYTPRLRVGRCVVAPRMWRFFPEVLGSEVAGATESLARWRREWNIPRYVLMQESDHVLLLDLDCAAVPQLVLDQARGKSEIIFREVFPSFDRQPFSGADGIRAVEFVASLSSRDPIPHAATKAPAHLLADRRVFGPGSAWTYLKLYLGEQAMDAFISTALLTLIDELREQGAIDEWFYLRYADPTTHVRVRMRASRDAAVVREVAVARAEGWLEAGLIRTFAVDTFSPEYERYGVDGFDDVLRFFSADSSLCARMVKSLRSGSDARVAAAAESFNRLLAPGDHDEAIIAAFSDVARAGMSASDRAVLKRLQRDETRLASPLSLALMRHSHRRLVHFLHMHCNRLGVDREGERRAAALLRAAALGRRSRRRAARDTRVAPCTVETPFG